MVITNYHKVYKLLRRGFVGKTQYLIWSKWRRSCINKHKVLCRWCYCCSGWWFPRRWRAARHRMPVDVKTALRTRWSMVAHHACRFCTAWLGACGAARQGLSVFTSATATVGSQRFPIAKSAWPGANAVVCLDDLSFHKLTMLFYSTSLFLQMCKLTTIMVSFCVSSLIAFGLSRSLGRSKAKTLSI